MEPSQDDRALWYNWLAALVVAVGLAIAAAYAVNLPDPTAIADIATRGDGFRLEGGKCGGEIQIHRLSWEGRELTVQIKDHGGGWGENCASSVDLAVDPALVDVIIDDTTGQRFGVGDG